MADTTTNSNTSFSWKNYTKATPKNLLVFSRMIQGVLLGISTLSTFSSWPVWVTVSINVSIIVVSQLTLFFGNVAEDEEKMESAVAEFPSGATATITQPIPLETKPNDPPKAA